MADFDPEEFLEQTGIDVRLGGAPTPEPPLSSVGAQAQADLLHQLSSMRAAIEIMESLARDYPSNDFAFDAINAALGKSLNEAGAALQRFRERRDCVGAS